MPGRGPQSFNKRQKEQQRKEKQQAKFEKRLQRRRENGDQAPQVDHSAELETKVAPDPPHAQ